MNGCRHQHPFTLCLLSGVVMASIVCQAQEQEQQQEAEDDALVEEILVLGLADRFSSGVGRAEYRVGKEDVRQRPAGSEITQSLVKVPGVQVSTGDSRGGSFSFELYLRGLNDQQIGLSVDGVPTGDARFNGGSPPNRFVDGFNVSQIVVSQSSGEIGSPSRSALGGFIDFVTDAPAQDFGLNLEAGVGSEQYGRYAVRIDTGEIADGLSAYASYSYQANDIFAGPNHRDRQRDHVDLKLQKDFANGVRVAYRSSFNELEDNDFGIVSFGDFQNDPRSDTVNDFFAGDPSIDGGFTGFGGALGGTREDKLHYVKATLPMASNLTLSITPYWHSLRGESLAYQTQARITASGDPRDQNVSTIRTENGTRVADLRITPRNRDRSGVTAELEVTQVADALDIRAGVWFENDETNEDRNFYRVNNAATGIDFSRNALNYIQYERDVATDTAYYYLAGSWTVSADLSLNLGITRHDLEYDYRSPIEFSGNNIIDAETEDVDIKFGGVYRLTGDWEAFVGYSENFGGIFEDTFLGSSDAIDTDVVKPETSENFDIGLRYVTDNVAVSLQAYVIDFDNRLTTGPNDIDPARIADVINGNSSTQVINQGGIRSTGFEVTAAVLAGIFDLYGIYAHRASEWQEDDPSQGIRKGDQVQDIAKRSLFGEIGWRPSDSFRAALNVQYTGERTGGNIFVPGFCNRFFCFDGAGNGVNPLQFLESQQLDTHWIVNFLASYDLVGIAGFEGLTLQLNIDNLLDEEFIGAVTGATSTLPEFGVIGGLTAESALDRYFIGHPRTATLSVRATF
ncbi:MAG: TonB-dependent receptor [Gammaproteobacteria bacterium]|nr:TonB-dependent receptor [Gammaproteobacteria bacterium]